MKQNKQKLMQENILLKAKILLKNALFHKKSNLPLEIENKFLDYVLNFEEAIPVPMFDYLKIDLQTFPPENTLDDQELIVQFKRLEQLLNDHNIVIDLVNGLPRRLAYKFITEEALLGKYEFVEDVTVHLDGCSGYCPDCFQADYCAIKDEIWSEEELKQEHQKKEPYSE